MGITCNQYAAVQLGVMGPGPIGNLRPPKKNIQNSDCIKINNKYSVNRGHPVCLHSSLKKMPNPARPNQELLNSSGDDRLSHSPAARQKAAFEDFGDLMLSWVRPWKIDEATTDK